MLDSSEIDGPLEGTLLGITEEERKYQRGRLRDYEQRLMKDVEDRVRLEEKVHHLEEESSHSPSKSTAFAKREDESLASVLQDEPKELSAARKRISSLEMELEILRKERTELKETLSARYREECLLKKWISEKVEEIDMLKHMNEDLAKANAETKRENSELLNELEKLRLSAGKHRTQFSERQTKEDESEELRKELQREREINDCMRDLCKLQKGQIEALTRPAAIVHCSSETRETTLVTEVTQKERREIRKEGKDKSTMEKKGEAEKEQAKEYESERTLKGTSDLKREKKRQTEDLAESLTEEILAKDCSTEGLDNKEDTDTGENEKVTINFRERGIFTEDMENLAHALKKKGEAEKEQEKEYESQRTLEGTSDLKERQEEAGDRDLAESLTKEILAKDCSTEGLDNKEDTDTGENEKVIINFRERGIFTEDMENLAHALKNNVLNLIRKVWFKIRQQIENGGKRIRNRLETVSRQTTLMSCTLTTSVRNNSERM
ncbi:uncharacterized protein LOC135221146 [Macrobrachium nipponense]|uniref:uncharacterized protein LOC135221146 n=1 Tax=Macrobrachium nipponense TaxID=159736 RepID=UPI0030C8948C